MPKILQPILIVIAVISVALGDIFIKKASQSVTLSHVFSSRYMFLGVILYLLQIVLFAWMFFQGWNLGIVGIMQTVLYALIVLGAGHFIFKEYLNAVQLAGLLMACVGVVIANVAVK